jgi:hypothetical protein
MRTSVLANAELGIIDRDICIWKPIMPKMVAGGFCMILWAETER